MTQPVANQRGMALVIVLMVVAILTIIVTEFTFSAQVDQHMVRNSLSGLQASLLARSGVHIGEAFLLHDNDFTIDAFTEEWCPLPGPQGQSCLIDETNSGIVIAENMRLRVQIFDEGAKFSINLTKPRNLSDYNQLRTWEAGGRNPAGMPAFERRRMLLAEILQGGGVPPETVDALGDYWVQSYEQLRQAIGAPPMAGAGTSAGGAATPGMTPGNQPVIPQQGQMMVPDFASLDDVGVVPGFTPAALRRIRGFITAYDTRRTRFATAAISSPININTAPRRLLELLLGDPGVVESIITERQTQPIRDPVRLVQPIAALAATDPARQQVQALFTSPTSSLFLIRASAVINPNPITGKGGIGRTAFVIVRRDPKPGVGPNPPPGVSRWMLTRVEWGKEGGAALFRDDVDPDLLGPEGSPSTPF